MTDPVAQAVCRAAGHAAGTAHIADHSTSQHSWATSDFDGIDRRCLWLGGGSILYRRTRVILYPATTTGRHRDSFV
ncbi:MAG: putative immunity protein [Bacteroidota bacterium]